MPLELQVLALTSKKQHFCDKCLLRILLPCTNILACSGVAGESIVLNKDRQITCFLPKCGLIQAK